MKLRIKFSKQGPVKFIGHLDLMRYFQKAVRRAGIDIKYSEGFNPHQIMSFAAPLGVGLTSNGEYMDIEVNAIESCEKLAKRLNEEMAKGIRILDCKRLSDNAKNAMSLVTAADYSVTFREGKKPKQPEEFFRGFSLFVQQEQILTVKKSKSGEKETDIKGFLYDVSIEEERIFLKIAAGSTNNLKPDLVMEAYDQRQKTVSSPFSFHFQREELYGIADGKFLPLGQIGVFSE